MKGDVFTRGCHVLLIQMSCCHCSSCPLSTAYWPCLMPPHTGEVHAGGAGKPGAVQKVFRPGAEAEQPKHEGIVWSVHGEYCFCMERKVGQKGRGRKKQKQ